MKQVPVLIYRDAPYPARPLKWPNGSKNILSKLLPQDRTLQPDETAATEARSKCLKKQRDALVAAVSQKLKSNPSHFCGFTGSLLSAHNTIAAPQ